MATIEPKLFSTALTVASPGSVTSSTAMGLDVGTVSTVRGDRTNLALALLGETVGQPRTAATTPVDTGVLAGRP